MHKFVRDKQDITALVEDTQSLDHQPALQVQPAIFSATTNSTRYCGAAATTTTTTINTNSHVLLLSLLFTPAINNDAAAFDDDNGTVNETVRDNDDDDKHGLARLPTSRMATLPRLSRLSATSGCPGSSLAVRILSARRCSARASFSSPRSNQRSPSVVLSNASSRAA